MRSDDILQRLSAYHAVNIDLTLRDSYSDLLRKLGNPHLSLPPVIHVAGTNGKGSTIAFMRAILEASGLRVHVYTSPHLVSFHERICLAGKPISEDNLCNVLLECERTNRQAPVTLFEITTAAAFLAFSRTPADVLLLEVGLGGRLDATNVVQKPLATAITRISYDHRDFLGNTIEEIAGEKAGIFKKNIPAIIAPQYIAGASKTLNDKAQAAGAQLFTHGTDWSYIVTENGFDFGDGKTISHFPRPNLVGNHQYANAATAIAILKKQTRFEISDAHISAGITNAVWPARLQKLWDGPLVALLPEGSEVWLDGGHNDSAGEVLAKQAEDWARMDTKPLLVIAGMLASKSADEFLGPLAAHITALAGISIPGESKSMDATALTQTAQKLGVVATHAAPSASDALVWLLKQNPAPVRVLITGSLYLAGHILKENR